MTLVPSNKLIFLTAITFLPMTFLLAMHPGNGLILGIFLMGICGIAGMDARGAAGILDEITVQEAEILRLTRGQTRGLQVRVQARRLRDHLTVGLALPRELKTKMNTQTLRLPKAKKEDLTAAFTWQVTATELGRYPLKRCYCETSSPLRLWLVRSEKPLATEVRVYPNLIDEQRDLTGLFMKKNLGVHARAMIGKGREFEQLREYIPGDSYEDIHWKATAKRRSPVTKVYQLERTQLIYTVIDSSRLSTRLVKEGQQVATVCDKFVSAAFIMGLATQRQGDHYGIITFDKTVNNFIRASSGKAHFNAVRDTLYTLKPRTVTPDYTELLTFIGTKVRHRTLMIFLTHMDDPVLAENFIQNIPVISRQHVILVNMLKPRGAAPLFSSPDVATRDDLYKNLAGHMINSGLNETKRYLKSLSVEFNLLDNEKMFVQLVKQYMDIKRRQIL